MNARPRENRPQKNSRSSIVEGPSDEWILLWMFWEKKKVAKEKSVRLHNEHVDQFVAFHHGNKLNQ